MEAAAVCKSGQFGPRPCFQVGLLETVLAATSGHCYLRCRMQRSAMRVNFFFRSLGFAIALVLQDPAGGAQFKLPGHVFTLPDGFEIERVAGPPLADRPIGADFDEQGRLYVSDSSGSNEPVQKQLQTRPHRIVRLEDTDGDGRFDNSVVFADKMMFPEGVLWHEGSLYVGAPPSIWKLRDTDGDGVADERTEWFKSDVLTGCANDIHGPYLGRDGWLYWTKGAFGKQNIERPGKPPITDSAAHIYRARPDGSDLESFMAGGMDNPVEIVFTPEGEVIFTTTFYSHPEAGKRDGIVHAIYGGVYPKTHGVIDGLKRTGDLMPILTHLGPSASSGLCRYNSQVFGEEFQGNLFSTLFNMRKIMRHVLHPQGATFASTDSDFLVSDNPDFHPTDVLEDADGTLIVIDTGGWYKLCCPTSQIAKPEVLGAIYRIRRKDTSEIDDPRGRKLAWPSLKPARLAKLLDDPRPFVQHRAMAEMAKRGNDAVSALRSMVKKRSMPQAAINALWTLGRIGSPSAFQAMNLAHRARDVGVRQVGVYLAGLQRDTSATAQIIDALQSDSPHLRREAATALGRLGDKAAVPALLQAAKKQHDRALEHALIYALIEIDDSAGTRRGLQAASAFTQRAALIALDQMDHGSLQPAEVSSLLVSPDPVLRETATWIVSHRPEWGPTLAGFFRNRLRGANLTAADREELQRQLTRLARNAAIQQVMGEFVGDTGTAQLTRELLLRAMAESGLREMPPAWGKGLRDTLLLNPETTLPLALAVIRTLPPAKTNATDFSQPLLHLARDIDQPAEVRLEAVAAAHGAVLLDEATFSFVRAQVNPARPPLQRTTAAAVLSRARLDDRELTALTDTLRIAGPLELPKLLGAFERRSNEAVGLKLVAALRQANAFASLRGEQLKPLLARYPASVQEAAQPLFAQMDADAAKQRERLDEFEKVLVAGNRDRGRRIFESVTTACSTCHQVGYIGGKIGPDLSRIGAIRTERDLLEGILFPSASFVRSYEPVIVTTKDGEEHSGVLHEESGQTVTLISGPGSEVRLARAQIQEMRPGALSIMPQGLDEQLSQQEMADLIVFLKSLK